MDKQMIKQNWQAIKKEIKKNWTSLSEYDLDRSNGNLKSVSKLVQKNYRQEQEDEIKKALKTIVEKFGSDSHRPIHWKTVNLPVYHRDFRNPTRH